MLVGLRSRRGRVRIPIFCLFFSKSLPFPHKRGRNDCPICYGSEAQEIKGTTEVYSHSLMLLKKMETVTFLWSQLLTIAQP